MATRAEITDVIAQRLGNRGAALDTQIVVELQQAQRELEAMPELPWFLASKDTSKSTAANTQTVTLPTGWLMEHEEEGLWVIDASGKYWELTKDDYRNARREDFLTNDAEGDATGLPERYTILGLTLYLFPTPDAVYSLELNHYNDDTTLSADSTENQWGLYASDVLIGKAGMAMSRFARDEGALQLFTADYQQARQRMLWQNVERSEINRDRKMGG